MTAFLRRDRGATTVEAALVLPLALALLGGILLFGLRLTYAALADHAAAVGLRTATLRGTTSYLDDVTGNTSRYPNKAKVTTSVTGLFGGVLGSPTSVALGVPSVTKKQGVAVQLTLTYDVPAVHAAADLVDGVLSLLAGHAVDLGTPLGTVTASKTGRLE
ncbi:MAG: hypothetical protein JWM64_2651 [Frankiales bacterium]|nr:hypothetical protein [Frankiales bacterium]